MDRVNIPFGSYPDEPQGFAQVRSERPNKILVRFRQFVREEQLTSADVFYFLATASSWWLLTSRDDEREHAERVLGRLGIMLDDHEKSEEDAHV